MFLMFYYGDYVRKQVAVWLTTLITKMLYDSQAE